MKLIDSFRKCFHFAKYLLEIKSPSPRYRYICMKKFSQIQNIRRILGYPVFNFSSHISNPACILSEWLSVDTW